MFFSFTSRRTRAKVLMPTGAKRSHTFSRFNSTTHAGGVLGYTLGMVNGTMEKQAAAMPNKPPTMSGGSFSGPPKVLALNLAVFSAVQGGLTLAVKKYRGKDDITTNMIGMLGAGAALSLCTNLGPAPPSPGQVKPTTPIGYATDAVRTGVLFATLNGGERARKPKIKN